MKRETFNEAIVIDKQIQDMNERIMHIDASVKITFECGPTVFSITSGGFGFAEAKKATIAKLQSMKEHYEKKFDEL